MTTLETQRLRLRRFTADDGAFMVALLNDPQFIHFVGDREVRTVDAGQRYIADRIAPQYKKGLGSYVVERKSDGVLIGQCGLFVRESLDTPDIGFSFLSAYHRQGYAFEAASAVLEHGQQLGLRRVVAITVADHHDSIKLIERLGLRFERMIRLPDEDIDLRLYALDCPSG
jgi:RimJ/RimL family protein N-acetyltransferase